MIEGKPRDYFFLWLAILIFSAYFAWRWPGPLQFAFACLAAVLTGLYGGWHLWRR